MLLALLACIDPATYGAVPDDHKDDAPAFQRAVDEAIESHADVCIGPGVWNLARRPGHVGAIDVTGGPIALRGAGARTVLRLTGPGQHRDWRILYVKNAHDVVIRDLTLDALDASDTEEQTHLIELAPGTHDVVIGNVTFGPMRRPDQRVGQGVGGDCIRMLGEPGHEVADVVIADSTFVDCDRSGVGFQRALRDIALVRDTIRNTGDTAIDFEPTGRGAIEDVAMVDLTIAHPPLAQCAWAITLGGIGADLASRLLIERATIEGGGIGMLNVADVEIADSLITSHPRAGAKPTISMIRRASRVALRRNTITRDASSDPGFVIRAAHNNGLAPSGLTIEGNTLRQATAHPVIGALSASAVAVRDNVIDYTAGDASVVVVQASAVIADITGVTIERNEVRGQVAGLVTASRRGNHTVGGVALHGNRGAGEAVRCNGADLHPDGAAVGSGAVTCGAPLPPGQPASRSTAKATGITLEGSGS